MESKVYEFDGGFSTDVYNRRYKDSPECLAHFRHIGASHAAYKWAGKAFKWWTDAQRAAYREGYDAQRADMLREGN